MEEKLLSGKQNGMPVLLGTLVLYILAVIGIVLAVNTGIYRHSLILAVAILVVCVAWLCLGWILLCGLKVLKPQEALVLTLFGQYVGTLRGEGFYWVNPFCTAVNPAAKTKLKQSGDVDAGTGKILLTSGTQTASA